MATTYSHGLEKIYAFEVLNPSTVRRVETQPPASTPIKTEIKPNFQPECFAFCIEGLPSLLLDESVETLGLTPFQMKAVQARAIHTVRELIHDLPALKTHAEEIGKKIHELLGPAPFTPKMSVDWLTLLRRLFRALDAKERFIYLDSIGQRDLFSLKPVELIEVEKWPSEMRVKALRKAGDALLSEKNELKRLIRDLSHAFFVPWLERRGGFGATFELQERMAMIGEEKASQAVATLFTIAPDLLHDALIPLEKDIFAASKKSAHDYRSIREAALSYLYSPFSAYPLDYLRFCLQREFAKKWVGFEADYIDKVLRFSPSFQLFRNEKGIIFLQKRHDLC